MDGTMLLFSQMTHLSPHSESKGKKWMLIFKESNGAKIRNRYNQVPYLTQNTNGKVTNSHLDTIKGEPRGQPFPSRWTPKPGQKLLLVIIDGCLATRQNGFICYTWYYKTIIMATRLSILAYGITWTTYCIHGFIEISSITKVYQKIIIIYFKKSKQGINS